MSIPEQLHETKSIDTTTNAAKAHLGPLLPFLEDPSVKFIVVNGPGQIYVSSDHSWERLRQIGAHFEDLEKLQVALGFLVRRTMEERPYSEEIYLDGTRVTAMVPPLVTGDPVILIRKPRSFVSTDDWISSGACSPEAMEFLRAAVIARLNVMICGDAGAGKTTLLETLASFIPADERIGVIGPLPLPLLEQEHVVGFTPHLKAMTMRDIVHNAPNMRLDRLIVDEAAEREVKPMLELMASGQDGTLFTIGGSDITKALAHLGACCLLEDARLGQTLVRQLIISAVNLIVLTAQSPNVDRHRIMIIQISEIDQRGVGGDGYHNALIEFQHPQDAIWTRDIFKRVMYEGRDKGLKPTGAFPLCLKHIEATNIRLPASLFRVRGESEMLLCEHLRRKRVWPLSSLSVFR